MSNILVTGGSGFIGSHIIETLKEANHKVFNIDRTNSTFGDIYEDIDINDSAKVEKFLKENLTKIQGIASIRSYFSLKQVTRKYNLPIINPKNIK